MEAKHRGGGTTTGDSRHLDVRKRHLVVTGLTSVSKDILWRTQENAMEITGTLLGVAESVGVSGPIARPENKVMPAELGGNGGLQS